LQPLLGTCLVSQHPGEHQVRSKIAPKLCAQMAYKRLDPKSLETYHGLVWKELSEAFIGAEGFSQEMKKCILQDLLMKLCDRLHKRGDELPNLVTENIRDNE
jgi:hypothetical protein